MFKTSGNFSYWEARHQFEQPLIFHAAGVRTYFVDYSGPWTLRGTATVQVVDPEYAIPILDWPAFAALILIIGVVAYRHFARRRSTNLTLSAIYDVGTI